ncbi:MAG: type II toxin-antitoxin system VapC family toxin [Acidimicrobiales bacterium]
MRALLDINVLLALLDRDHLDHQRARSWLESEIAGGWASCPITENGFVGVISQRRYPNPISPAEAITLLAGATAQPHCQFWACDRSLLDASVVDRSRLHGPRQVTDAYLLALATVHRGRFVTFDRSISIAVAPGATADNLVVM